MKAWLSTEIRSDMPGWIKLHRSSEFNPLYFAEPFTRWQAWSDLLLLANPFPSSAIVRGIVVDIERGQALASEKFLAERWKWSRGKVRRFLAYLSSKTVHQIVQQKNNVCTVITITNYEHYQGNGTANGTASSTADGPQTIQQTDTLKKERKAEKKQDTGETGTLFSTEAPESKGTGYTSEFELWWKLYPKKSGKGAAFKAFKKAKKSEPVSKLMAAVKAHNENWRTSGTETRFIPNPATWLNECRYDDELEVTGFTSPSTPKITEELLERTRNK